MIGVVAFAVVGAEYGREEGMDVAPPVVSAPDVIATDVTPPDVTTPDVIAPEVAPSDVVVWGNTPLGTEVGTGRDERSVVTGAVGAVPENEVAPDIADEIPEAIPDIADEIPEAISVVSGILRLAVGVGRMVPKLDRMLESGRTPVPVGRMVSKLDRMLESGSTPVPVALGR